MRCESDAERDHADYDGKFAIGLLNAEGPGDKEDGNWRKRLDNRSIPKNEERRGGAHLEHLYVGHAEIEIGGVAQDEASAE